MFNFCFRKLILEPKEIILVMLHTRMINLLPVSMLVKFQKSNCWAKYLGKVYRMYVCVCVLPGSFRGMGAFYSKIESRRDILNTTLLTNCIKQQ